MRTDDKGPTRKEKSQEKTCGPDRDHTFIPGKPRRKACRKRVPPSSLMVWSSHPQQGDSTACTSKPPCFPTPTTFLPGDPLSVAAVTYRQQGDSASPTSKPPHLPTPTTFLPGDMLSVAAATSTETDHVPPFQALKCGPPFSNLLWRPLVFIPPSVALSPSILVLLMNTRKKNKSAHPGIPDMTPLQLASAQLASVDFPRTARRPSKKLTKDQQIAALNDELQALRELVLKVRYFVLHLSDLIALTAIHFPGPGGQQQCRDVAWHEWRYRPWNRWRGK